ncbi:MAG: hypothetical protein WC184_09790, partial [Acidimicrobiia bacterium]
MTLNKRIRLAFAPLAGIAILASLLLLMLIGNVNNNVARISNQVETQRIATQGIQVLQAIRTNVYELGQARREPDRVAVLDEMQENLDYLADIHAYLDEHLLDPNTRAALEEWNVARGQNTNLVNLREVRANAVNVQQVAMILAQPEVIPLLGESIVGITKVSDGVTAYTQALTDSSQSDYSRARMAGIVAVVTLVVGALIGERLLTRGVSRVVGSSAVALGEEAVGLAVVSSQLGANAEEAAVQAGVVSAAA